MNSEPFAESGDPVTVARPDATGRHDAAPVITARKLEGTTVFGATGEKVGSIEDIMIDKASGQVAYAVLSFGGLLGIGERHHPLPWTVLKFDPVKSGYVVDFDQAILTDAPSYTSFEDVSWADEGWSRRVHDYYKAKPYWTAAQ
jgi:sporulation protein YlmC with PRC-barrel domain